MEILFQPGSLKGFMSATDPMALPPGYASLLQNVRIQTGPMVARNGDAVIKTAIAAGTIRGACECVQDGIRSLFAAIGDGSKVAIWRSTDQGVNWVNVTPSSGSAYGVGGDTRLTDSTSVPIRWCIVKDRPFGSLSANDLLLIQNGIDAPRVFGKGTTLSTGIGSGTYGTAVVLQPTAPPVDTNLKAYTGFDTFLTVGNASTTSYSNVGVGFSGADSGASTTANNIVLTITAAGYVAPTFSTVTFTAAKDFSDSTHFAIIARSSNYVADPTWYTKLTVSLVDSATAVVTQYDLGLGIGSVTAIPVPNAADGAMMLVYPIDTSGLIDYATIKAISFTHDDVPSVDETIYVYMVATGGELQGGTNFAVSAYSSDTRQESPAQVITTTEPGPISLAGGPTGTGYTIPESGSVFYHYRVSFSSPSTAQKNGGIDYAFLYRNDVGSNGYYYAAEIQTAEFIAGAWDWVGATGASQPIEFDDTGDVTAAVDQSKEALDSDYICLQIGTTMAMANSRLFTTALEGGTISRLYYSKVDRPFALRRFVQFIEGQAVPDSGGSLVFDGQTIQTIVAQGSFAGAAESLNSPIVGSATIFVLTDANVGALSGFDALSLNRFQPLGPYGTLSPLSVARSQFGFYWLDQKGQVRFYSGTFASISINRVDDKTTTVPASRKVWVSGGCANESYYLAYTPSDGSLNTNCLVWNERLGEWESEDTFSGFSAGILIPAYNPSSGLVRVLSFTTVSANGSLYEYAKPSDVTNVSVRAVFPERGDIEKLTIIKAMGIQSSKGGGATITYTTRRTFKGIPASAASTNPVDGTISVGGAPTFIWEWDQLGVGGSGATMKPEILGTVPGGTTIYRVFAQISDGITGIQRTS